MSDIGKLRRPGSTFFPNMRKSVDPLMPEMGQIEFSQDVREFDTHFSTSVSESEKTEENVISDETKRKQFRQRQRKKKEEEESKLKKEKEGNGSNHVDLMA
ncbi:MAG: hypothetical protein ACM3SY_22185 [Candidatus Omnitrophota bacterium]